MDAVNKTMGNGGRFAGSAPTNFSIAQNVPGSPGFFNASIPTQGNNQGDTVYMLVSNVFDPRTLQTTAGANTYSTITSGYAYTQLAQDYLYRLIFEQFRMRTEPNLSTINEMIDTIADIGRMLGIYLTALSMKQSRDPEMFARARSLSLNNTFAEMQSMLQYLPLPRNIVNAAVKYIRLMDVAAKDNYQNVGFLVNGDYDAFVALSANVRSRPLALNYLRQLYPELGVIGDPASGYNADVMEAFANANVRLGASGFAPRIVADGSSGEVERMMSFGLLSSVVEATNAAFTVTGWAAPGSGAGGVANVRVWNPSLCRWKTSSNRDAAVTYTSADATYSNTAGVVTFETVRDAALAANIAHEYNMSYDTALPARNHLSITSATGVLGTVDALAVEDVRYRVSAGFGLAFSSYKLDGNIMTGIYSMLAP